MLKCIFSKCLVTFMDQICTVTLEHLGNRLLRLEPNNLFVTYDEYHKDGKVYLINTYTSISLIRKLSKLDPRQCI
jgi:hypothetical protein